MMSTATILKKGGWWCMPSEQERNRIFSEINVIKSQIGQCRNKIDSLKSTKAEYRDINRTYSKEFTRAKGKSGYINEDLNMAVCNTDRILSNVQFSIDELYAQIDALYKKKTALYLQLQSR
jgi:prefoldin subunit 5